MTHVIKITQETAFPIMFLNGFGKILGGFFFQIRVTTSKLTFRDKNMVTGGK